MWTRSTAARLEWTRMGAAFFNVQLQTLCFALFDLPLDLPLAAISTQAWTSMSSISNHTPTEDEAVCFPQWSIVRSGHWMEQSPLSFTLPLFMLQVVVVFSTSLITHCILKPFKLPRVVTDILVRTFNLSSCRGLHNFSCFFCSLNYFVGF